MASLEELEDVETGSEKGQEQHSLPVYSEIEGETRKSSSRRPVIMVIVLLLLVVGTIVGLYVGVLKKDSEESSIDSAQSESFSSPGPVIDDMPPVPAPTPVEEPAPVAPQEEPAPEEVPTPQPTPQEEEESTPEETEPEEIVPEEESEAPVNVTEAPVNVTEAPVEVTEAPVEVEVEEEEEGNATSTTSPPDESLAEVLVPVDPALRGNATRIQVTIEFLAFRGIASKAEMETEGTYAFHAVNWIANEEQFLLPIPNDYGDAGNRTRTVFLPLAEEEIFITRYVMAHIYFALGGPKWTHKANFLSSKPTCQWMEVVDSFPIGVGCTPTDNRVRSLYLHDNKLQNHLPKEIGFLTDLIMLDLGNNFVMGTIPDSFQDLTNMEHLNLGSAGISGTLPSWIGTMTNLGSLNLGYNVMHGTVPSEITGLTGLRELALDHNSFEGDVNELFGSGSLSLLEELFLDSNKFAGEISKDFLAFNENLIQLDLSDNTFWGEIPEHFFTYSKLEVLDIHDNAFTKLPKKMDNTALKFFAAQKNALVGDIDGITGLSALTHLDLSQNTLTGPIPESLGESVVGLNYLFLAENNFDAGAIPLSLSNLFSLKELSLKSTSRTGDIPNVLGMMTELVFFDLDNNELQGTIPSTLGSLTNLEVLLLNRNSLTNDIPSEFGKLNQLQTFFVEGNQVSGGLNFVCGDDTVEREIVAQCSLCDQALGCCTLCCDEGVECNQKTHVADLDPIWQLSYERLEYSLDKEDLWR